MAPQRSALERQLHHDIVARVKNYKTFSQLFALMRTKVNRGIDTSEERHTAQFYADISRATGGRVLFLSADFSIGLGPRNMKPGDSIVVPLCSEVP